MPNNSESSRPYDVLIVEDNADDAELFTVVLRKVQGDLEIEINLQSVSDGAAAAIKIKEQRFDVIFLDINLPPPDGMELTRQIRGSVHNRTTPIVILSGAEGRGVLGRAFEAGANMFLFKPIDRRQLVRLLEVARAPIDRERRRVQRVKVKCKVSLESGKDRLDAKTLDLSLNGMFVQASRVLPVGSVVNVSLTLPNAQAPLHTAARIVRVVGTEFMGLQLENIGKAESERLAEFLVPLIVSVTEGTPVAS